MRYVATIHDVRERERIRVRKKHIPSGVQALQLDDNGHVWLIRGEITRAEIKSLFRCSWHFHPVKDEQVTVYDAHEDADETITTSLHERESPISIVATFSSEQDGP